MFDPRDPAAHPGLKSIVMLKSPALEIELPIPVGKGGRKAHTQPAFLKKKKRGEKRGEFSLLTDVRGLVMLC